MISPAQKMQVDEWLKEADKCIREGRYIAADEWLQKALHVQPDSTTALSYQDRIQFLTNQLSQRFGLRDELQMEVRKYRDLIIKRKSNQVNTFLVSARQYLEDGHFKRAGEQVSKVLVIDPDNTYAKALQQRLSELQIDSATGISKESEYKFRALLKESWANGRPAMAQQEILANVQKDLKIPEETRTNLERDVRNSFYKEALHEIWVNGGLAAFSDEMIDTLRSKFEISRVDHSSIEMALLREVRKNKVRGMILIVDGDEATLRELTRTLRLQSYAVAAAISPEEALATIKMAIPDVVISELNFEKNASGFDLYQAIRSTGKTKHVPFFFISETFDRTTEIIGRRLGIDEFITKPIDYEMLHATLSGRLLNRDDQKSFPAKR
ncbi:MAG: response regulator [Ignavibacteria bacterium]|nr:response regulator [Ignavibacteria bacterium]